jgi:hypothetical protein
VLRDTLVFRENVPGVPREIPKNAKKDLFFEKNFECFGVSRQKKVWTPLR